MSCGGGGFWGQSQAYTKQFNFSQTFLTSGFILSQIMELSSPLFPISKNKSLAARGPF